MSPKAITTLLCIALYVSIMTTFCIGTENQKAFIAGYISSCVILLILGVYWMNAMLTGAYTKKKE